MIGCANSMRRRRCWAPGAILTAVLLPSLSMGGTRAPDSLEIAPPEAAAGGGGTIHQDQFADVQQKPARFEIEAEAFTARDNGSDRGDWVKVAGRDNRIQEGQQQGEAAATTPGHARKETYLLAVGNSATGAPGGAGYDGPTVDYKVKVVTPGTYRLYLRWAGKDDNTDSVYAMLIAEEGDAPKGPEFFLYHGRSLKYYAGWVWDSVGLKDQTQCGFAGRGQVAQWKIDTPGIYTIRLAGREAGTAIDSLVFQTADLPAPGNPRDAMRVKPGMWGVTNRVIDFNR